MRANKLTTPDMSQYRPITKVLEPAFMTKVLLMCGRTKRTWLVRVIDGRDHLASTQAEAADHPELSSSCSDFLVFEFLNPTSGVKVSLFQCKHEDSCHRMVPNVFKFFDHLRSHTKERPFVCNHPHCG